MAKKRAPRGYPKGQWTKESIRFLEERYLAKDSRGRIVETPEGMCYRVSQKIASAEESFGAPEKEAGKLTRDFYNLLTTCSFLPNSPTLMNAGRDDSLQYAGCFVLPIEDSITSIFDAVKHAAVIHKSGGGTGFSFSRLRPKGSMVNSSSGIASGPVSFMKVFDAATNEVKQGGRRRGANMGVLRVDHPDILEFIDCKAKGGITNFNISVAVTDKFLKAVKSNGDYWLHDPYLKKNVKQLKAKKVFEKIIQMAWQTGDPGMLFLDRVNKSSANPIPSLGPIESTNPCVVGPTLIATEKGLVRIDELVKNKPKIKILTDNRVIDKKDLSLRSLTHFIDNGVKETWRLQTKSGFELVATSDHKIMTQRGWVELVNLREGEDKALIQAGIGVFNQNKKLPFIPQKILKGKNGRVCSHNLPKFWSRELGQVLGYLIGDGWLRRGDKNCRVGFSFGKDDEPVLDYLKPILNNWYGGEVKSVRRENNVIHLSYHGKYFVNFFNKLGVKAVKAEKKELPVFLFTAPKEAVVGFLQGLFSADGTVRDSRKTTSDWVALTSKSKKLLSDVQILLLNLGIKSRLFNRNRKPRKGMFPYKTKDGEKKTYISDGVLYELGIFGDFRDRFKEEVGFLSQRKQKHLENTHSRQRRSYKDKFSDLVVSVKKCGREHVYDLTEPISHSVIANGLVVHQCGEQPLYPNEACNLGSINLSLMVKKRPKEVDWARLGEVTKLATRFLDNVVELNPVPLKIVRKSILQNRRVGLGVMGWADMLFQLEIPYDSNQAIRLGKKVMSFIQKNAHQASQGLAKTRGPFPNFKKSIYKNGPEMRNATLTTIAPSGSISVIAGCSSGIEPIYALAFKHKANGRERTFFNSFFAAAAEKQGLDQKVIDEVKVKGRLEEIEIDSKLKKIFVTAHELGLEAHINMQAAFQAGTDNAVSKTINLPHEATAKDVEKAYLYAYQTGCMGITVYRDGCKEEQVLYAGEAKEKPKKTNLTIKARPAVIEGKTYRVETPVGRAYVTVNVNGESKPMEVFVNVGKAGSEIRADAEAIGRLVSLILRLGIDYPSKKLLSELVEQLEGIGGGSSVGFGKNRVRSLADAIAKVMKEHLGGESLTTVQTSEQPSLLLSQHKNRDLCPSCGRASLIYQEGCSKCLYCSYNKC